MEALSEFLVGLNLGNVVNDNDWVWPVCEIFHFFGMALLIGTVGLLDARILGLGKGIPISSLERLVPWGVAGFVINAVTGFIFIAGNPIGGPMDYLGNLALQIKMILVVIAGLNLLAYYFTGIAKAAVAAGPDDSIMPSAKVVAGISITMWFGVIIFGRLIMYNDTLLLALGL